MGLPMASGLGSSISSKLPGIYEGQVWKAWVPIYISESEEPKHFPSITPPCMRCHGNK